MNFFRLFLTQPLANGLVVFYKIAFSNMGLAIVLFSLFLRVVLSPLTKPYMESMKKMRKYQKDLDKIKKRHKGDRQKQMQAQADFYKQKGINPGAGCLPYLLQIMVFIALFRVFITVLGAEGSLTQAFNDILYEPLKFGADTVINTKFLYLDVTTPDVFNISGIPFALPGPILILAAIVQFISAKITAPYVEMEKKVAKKTKTESDDMMASMQGSMIIMFPLMTLLIGRQFPSGLAIYWLLFSFYQAYQQYRASGWGGLTPSLKRVGLVK